SLLGDIYVNSQTNNLTVAAPVPGTSGASPAALISGNLNLGTFFSGAAANPSGGTAGGVATRTIQVNETALFNLNPDLIISANISGASNVSLTKAGTGTLLLSGNNTYQGATRHTAGFIDVGSNTAFGNTSILSLSG